MFSDHQSSLFVACWETLCVSFYCMLKNAWWLLGDYLCCMLRNAWQLPSIFLCSMFITMIEKNGICWCTYIAFVVNFFLILLLVPFLFFSWHTMDLLHGNVDCSNMQCLDWNKSDEGKNEYTMKINI
jgi:hypothetical protein